MQFFKPWRLCALLLCVVLASCGGKGGSAEAPSGGATVVVGDGQATVTWTADPGVQYWVWWAPGTSISSTNPTTTTGHQSAVNVTSPYVVTGVPTALLNGSAYSFTVNGRISGGPGGPGTPSVTVTPRPAGVTWTAGGTMGSGNMNGVAYGAMTSGTSAYVAVGDSGAIYKSADALTWSLPTTNPAGSTALNGVTFTLSQFIAVGASGTVLTSPDSTTWTASTSAASATSNALNAIASNGSRVVTVGNSGTILYSANGTTWTAPTVAVPTSANLTGVTYAASGLWVAVGDSGTLLTSSDGNTWTLQASAATASASANLKAVSYRAAVTTATTYTAISAAVYVAVGGSTVITSADGVTWTSQTFSGSGLLALHSMTSQFLAVGSGGVAYTSSDSVTWTSQTTGTGNHLFGLINSNPAGTANLAAQYVAVGQSGTSWISK